MSDLSAQSRSFNKFYRQYSWSENSVKVTLPGILVKIGAKIAKNEVDDNTAREALKYAKHIKKLKVLVLEEDKARNVEKKKVEKLLAGLEKEKYETLVSVRENDTKVKLYIKTKKDLIRNLIVIVDEGDEFVAVNLKLKLKMEDLTPMLKHTDLNKYM
jgi:hypothetical protein